MFELIYGGSASGKSEFAECEALGLAGPHYYIATMMRGSKSGDERIAKHILRRRGTSFITVEQAKDISLEASRYKGATVLLECVTNLAANELFDIKADLDGLSDSVDAWTSRADTLCVKLAEDMAVINKEAANLIVVSGDFMRDGVGYDVGTEAYMRLVSCLNSRLAYLSDRVYEVVYSCAKRVK